MESQIAKQKELGNFQKADILERRLQKCKTIKANTRPASITKAEAIEARLNPKLSAAKDVTNLSHQAGMNAMPTGALIACCVSSATNIYECIANVKDPKKAIKHTALATLKGGLKGGAISYLNTFSSLSLGGMMQSSANKIIKSLGKGSAPAMIVGAGVASCKVFIDYFRGKIDRVECLEQLGEENTTFLSGIAMGSIGQLAIPFLWLEHSLRRCLSNIFMGM
ncbi:hypothetical protein MM0348_08600 [Helicobacter pylori]